MLSNLHTHTHTHTHTLYVYVFVLCVCVYCVCVYVCTSDLDLVCGAKSLSNFPLSCWHTHFTTHMQLAYSIYNPLYYSPTGGIYVLDDECRKDSCDVHSESWEGERGGCGKGKGEKESGGVVRLRDRPISFVQVPILPNYSKE